MSTRRTLLAFGVLLAAVGLLTPAVVSAQPTNVAIAKTSPSSFSMLEVTWGADPTAATEGYRVFYQKQANMDGTTQPTAANNSGHQDVSGRTTVKITLMGLDHNSYYRAAVAPIDGDGMVGSLVGLTETSATGNAQTDMAGKPAIPRNVMAMGGDKTLTVKWEAPYAGESSLSIKEYHVQKREVAGNLFGDWVPNMGDDKDGKKVMGDKTEIMFEGLENGVTYQARVRATNSAGVVGDYSVMNDDMSDPGDEAATVGDMDDDDMTGTPALPLFGILALFGGLLAAGRARLRR